MTLPKTLPAFLWHFIRPQWGWFLVLGLCSLTWGLNESIFPYFIKLIIDALSRFSGDRAHVYGALLLPLGGIVFSWLFIEVCMRSQGVLQLYLLPVFRARIRSRVFDYVSGHSASYFADQFAGTLASKVADLPRSCEQLVTILLLNFMVIIVGFIMGVFMLAAVSWLFAGVLLVWFSLHIGSSFLFGGYCNRYGRIHGDAVSTLSGKVVDVFSNMLNVRLFGRRTYEQKYFCQFQQDEIKKSRSASWAVEKLRIFHGLLGVVMMFLIIALEIYQWQHERITLGDVSMITMLSYGMLGLAWMMGYQVPSFYRELGTATSALSLISKEYQVKDHPHAKPLKISAGQIEFQNISFAYSAEQSVFAHLSILIPAGQKVGLVGLSGAGKSTFVNLILRSYDLNAGAILIDGQNIAEVTQHSLHHSIAMIPQEPSLFNRTLMENIRYGRLEATDAEVVEAAKKAHCHDFISELPAGYQSLVGDRGVKLSGGQRQRIAIARAILKNAPILILDEATSSLDSITEHLIQDSLDQLMQHRTTIVVAHRLSTLAKMDRIVVFSEGQIVEDGTQPELLAKQGCFAQLWQMQRDGFLQ